MSYHPVGARTNIRKKKSSLPNCHWNNKSIGTNRKKKKQYDTLEDAMSYIKKSGKLKYFTAYLCPYCNKFHVGHISNE